MQLPVVTLPRPVPLQRYRRAQANIPDAIEEREHIKQFLQGYVAETRPTPPLSFEELRRHADVVIERIELDPKFRDFVGVLLNNEVWREALAAVPFERRLLLLPKCLRIEDRCPAPFDEFGLLCKQCGLCSIQDLQNEAERLGYAVLVAEGSALVMAMIQTGKIEAIVGVSCLSVLEKAFPFMEAAAIPGIAIPLLQDDCKDTTVDLDWIWDVVHLTSEDRTSRLDLDTVRQEVNGWFTLDALECALGPVDGETDRLARSWLAQEGKRWRPFLSVCVYRALQDDPAATVPEEFRRAAVAVECFHKASLVHDDIEDDDAQRYGKEALHTRYGTPVALNLGDLLLGEGYRLLAENHQSPERRAAMLSAAAAGHRLLCLGQGAELLWARSPRPLGSLDVLGIFRRKTAPAFNVALQIGAAYAGQDGQLADVLGRYSNALGIAYQIQDDLDDLSAESDLDDLTALRPSLPLALAHERAQGQARKLLDAVWRRIATESEREQVRDVLKELDIEARCRTLLESYKEEAIRALSDLENASLKGLLRRVLSKIFKIQLQGWCSEFEARNAPGRPSGAEAIG
jgi:geranylgeranyl diphosphate synthase, type II